MQVRKTEHRHTEKSRMRTRCDSCEGKEALQLAESDGRNGRTGAAAEHETGSWDVGVDLETCTGAESVAERLRE
jgi:hypothetical protein